MSPRTRYWTIHWLRVALWPLPVLTLVRTVASPRLANEDHAELLQRQLTDGDHSAD